MLGDLRMTGCRPSALPYFNVTGHYGTSENVGPGTNTPTPNTSTVATDTTGINGHGPRPFCNNGRNTKAPPFNTTQNATTNTGDNNAAAAAHAHTSARAKLNNTPTRSQLKTPNNAINPHLMASVCHNAQPERQDVNTSYARTPTVNNTQISKNSR